MRTSCKFKTENEGRHVERRVGKGLELGFDFSNVHGQPKGEASHQGSSSLPALTSPVQPISLADRLQGAK
jgi:hypothetical protein